MFDLESFRRLVAPPNNAPAATDWRAVEARLGTSLPSDYKRLVDTYGLGSFGNFFHVFCPYAGPTKGLDLEYQHERTTWALDYLAEHGRTLPHPSADLLSCGRSDNGDVTYWITAGTDDPEQWRIRLGESRGHLWEEFNGGLGEWLEAVLSRRTRMKIFPKDFPHRTVRFTPIT